MPVPIAGVGTRGRDEGGCLDNYVAATGIINKIRSFLLCIKSLFYLEGDRVNGQVRIKVLFTQKMLDCFWV